MLSRTGASATSPLRRGRLRGRRRILRDREVGLLGLARLMRNDDLPVLAVFRRRAGRCAGRSGLCQQQRRKADRERHTNESKSPGHRHPPSEARQLGRTRFWAFPTTTLSGVLLSPGGPMLIPFFGAGKIIQQLPHQCAIFGWTKAKAAAVRTGRAHAFLEEMVLPAASAIEIAFRA